MNLPSKGNCTSYMIIIHHYFKLKACESYLKKKLFYGWKRSIIRIKYEYENLYLDNNLTIIKLKYINNVNCNDMINRFSLSSYRWYHGDPIKTRRLSVDKMKPSTKILNGY